ncbi:quercetin dioxygenase-like cupin family protein [Actinocorallia herbida]|uniref:Quercetin dioxygenase-like cupin family protein n=1 Tax=Actinocorallia herbida TaxID=58109 RepID=A0A3N1CXX5_9ACTN|nr:cupin domain-containing protein [Actinocorallia herbida]ROO86096.1 quercetin dioxygenase-like cupin family protein [Actinocorallia herbida]
MSTGSVATETTAWQPRDGAVPHIRRQLGGDGLTLVRLCFRAGQILDEHRAPGPILISCVSGSLALDVIDGSGIEQYELAPGTVVHLGGGVPHRLAAHTDAVVHLTVHRNVPPDPA